MTIQAWPFLVGRNRYLDYRTIVAPDFICEKRIANLLATVTDGDLTEQGHAISRQVLGTKVGDFVVVFQVVKASESWLDDPAPDKHNHEVLKDQFGREIYLIEGFVLKHLKTEVISAEVFQKARSPLKKAFYQFWPLIEPPPAVPASSFDATEYEGSRLLQIVMLSPFRLAKREPKRKLPTELGNSQLPALPTNLLVVIGTIVLLLIFSAKWIQ